jgi:hypothetical protein
MTNRSVPILGLGMMGILSMFVAGNPDFCQAYLRRITSAHSSFGQHSLSHFRIVFARHYDGEMSAS